MFKRIITAALVMAATVACATREERAEKLIDGLMRETLADYDSYEPVKTTVDSLFDIPTEKTEILILGHEGFVLTSQIDSLVGIAERHLKKARVLMYTDYDKAVECTDEADRCISKGEEIQKQSLKLQDDIIVHTIKCTGEHTGWQFTHMYRYVENGESVLGIIVINTDKNVRSILSHRDKMDERHAGSVSFIKYVLGKTEYSQFLKN